LEKISELPAGQVEGVADMSVDGRLKRCAFDVLAAEDHFGGRNKVRVFMDNVQNRVEALFVPRLSCGKV
jgi:hypothetical protein